MQIDTQLLALFCGHFLGDFVLQTDGLAARKNKHRGWLLYHVILVSVATWIFLGNFKAWWIAGLLFLLHLLVDGIKICFNNKNQNSQLRPDYNLLWFIGDQTLHIISIITLWLFINKIPDAPSLVNHWETLWGVNYNKGLILLSGLAVSIWGMGIVLKYQMTGFAAELAEEVKRGLPKGGKTIGMLERLLAFMFVLAGKPEGIGFIVAAKSVFRIGELTHNDDRDHAEYIMIGTLRSFTYALVIAFIAKWLIEHIR